jgi:hypothetical protein
MVTNKDSLIRKIRALRAKASDMAVTEAEAAAYAEKVQELLAAHGLEIGDLGAEKTEEETIAGQRHDFSGSPARQVMLRAVCLYYMCTAVGPARKGDPWTIVGRPTNVMVALEMFEYLLSTVIRMSNAYHRDNRGANKIDWRRGCMLRLAERLCELHDAERAKPQERQSNGNPGNLPALLHDEGRQVTAWMRANMQTKKSSTHVRQGDDAARGRAAAEGIGLHRQVVGAGRLMIGKG